VERGGEDGGLLLVPVTINGKGPFPFVLDTGATRTLLTRRFAASSSSIRDPK
jgi:predicted aspartyl protease